MLHLHRTLIPSFSFLPHFSSSSSSASSSSFCLLKVLGSVYPLQQRSQVGKEANMEALKASLRRESWCGAGQQPQGCEDEVLGEEAGWLVERGSFFGEGFSVDDLLDLGEDEKETEEDGVGEEFEAGDEARQGGKERSNSDSSTSSSSSSSSSLTFEPPPPPLSDICLTAHDVEQLEWVSYIIDDSISEFPPPSAGVALPSEDAQGHEDRHAPDAAAQGHSSLAPSVCALSTEAMALVKAKRSKRPRSAAAAAAWSMSGPLSLADSSSCSSTDTGTTTSACSCSSNTYSPLLIHHPTAGAAFDHSFLLCSPAPPPPTKNHKPKKKRGRKPKPAPPSSLAAPVSGERRCSHCGVQKTPQWRAGPLGAKTLCNACGVRFKSGRLLPEYRPACSPTFVSQLHSNSHRKVLEMRRKKESEFMPSAAPPVATF